MENKTHLHKWLEDKIEHPSVSYAQSGTLGALAGIPLGILQHKREGRGFPSRGVMLGDAVVGATIGIGLNSLNRLRLSAFKDEVKNITEPHKLTPGMTTPTEIKKD